MIRLVNGLALAFTIMVAFGLYSLKHSTGAAADQKNILKSRIAEQEEALRILRAEWAHLNRPERLQQLSNSYLTLQAIDPSQLVSISDLPLRPVIEEDLEGKLLVDASPFTDGEVGRAEGPIMPRPKPISYQRRQE